MLDEMDTGPKGLIDRLRSLEGKLRAVGVTSLGMFGSRARGDYDADSDLDVLVEIDQKVRFSVLDLANIAVMASDCMGLDVRPVLAKDASPSFLKRISDDLTEVF